MACVQWTDDLSVGNRVIDEQHKSLIDRLNAVSAALAAHHGEAEIMNTLGFLADYTTFHFSAEERFMDASSYPGLEAQKVRHQDFVDTLDELERDFREEGSTKILADAINTFLVNWLTNHIQGMDKTFADYLAGEGITLEE